RSSIFTGLACESNDGNGWRVSDPSGQALGAARSGAGEEHAEGGAAALAVLHPGSTSVQLREPCDERQPDPGPRRVGRWRWSLAERLEHGLVKLAGDARPLVVHGDKRAAVDRPGSDPNSRSLGGMADGIGEQVLHDALELGRI